MATRSSEKPKKATSAKPKGRAAAAVKVDRPRENRNIWFARFNNELSPQALLAEMGGTFVLVSAILFTQGDPFFTGISLIVISLGILAISGAHVNPAVTFGLWTMRKIPALRMVFYWLAQFLGAIAAIVLITLFSGNGYDFSLASFGSFDAKIFFAELFGAAVFLFGYAAAVHRGQTDSAKAVGIGLSLFLGLIMATGLLSEAVRGQAENASETTSESRLQKVNNVTLNPAVALALTEREVSAQQPQEGEEVEDTTPPSRLTIEVIFGTLIGGAIGANLYGLLAGRNREQI